MKTTNKTAESTAKAMAKGCHLDHYVVTSIVIILAFIRVPRVEELPAHVWLQFLCDARVRDQDERTYLSSEPKARADLAGRFHALIGQEVQDIFIAPNNTLSIQLESTSFDLIPCRDGSEIEWQMASNYPDPFNGSEWLVVADGGGDIAARAGLR